MGWRTTRIHAHDADLLRKICASGRIARALICDDVARSSSARCEVVVGSLLRPPLLQRGIRGIRTNALAAPRKMSHRRNARKMGFLVAKIREGSGTSE